jgi:hypothetical protein
MTTHARRFISLLLCTALFGALPVGAATAVSSGAGAVAPRLTATQSSLSFGEVTLGNYVGPQSFTMTNTSGPTTVALVLSGAAADDFAWSFESDCPAPSGASGQIISLGADQSCTVDMYFYPGALGSRNAILNLTNNAGPSTSIALFGTGGIGYYQVSSTGAVGYGGDAGYYGDASNVPLNQPIVGMAQTGDNGGYWLVAADGGVFSYGDAPFYGSAGDTALNEPIVGIAGSFNANGLDGYWLVAADGGVFSYGDAQFYGSAGSINLNQPIVGMAATPDGGGYWLVGADGGVFSYGDAQFYGSAGALPLVAPIVGMAAMPDGGGYWISAADGGLFSYGDSGFFGSGTGQGLSQVVGMATDGVPTLQAASDLPALRPHMARGGTSASDRNASGPRYFAKS